MLYKRYNYFFADAQLSRPAARKKQEKIELLEHEKEREIYQAKIEFFTNVAHEIRTPLTADKSTDGKIDTKSNKSA
jgi:signal transduction histidine kinase